MARTTGCHILGIDNNENGIAMGSKIAQEQGLDSKVCFQLANADEPLPFKSAVFDSVVCIDAINRLLGRARVFAEWYRVLKPGGRILFTDPIIVTGLLSNAEIATRSSIGYFLVVPPGEDERLLKETGFELICREDVTENEVKVSKRWHDARMKRRDELTKIEGEKTFEGLQQFLATVHRLSSERRLSRFVFLAVKGNKGLEP